MAAMTFSEALERLQKAVSEADGTRIDKPYLERSLALAEQIEANRKAIEELRKNDDQRRRAGDAGDDSGIRQST